MTHARTINAGLPADNADRTDPFLDAVTALLPALRAYACSLCGDPARADDLAQVTVIKAHTHRAQFTDSSNLRGWLFTILRNCHYSDLRRRKFEVEDPGDVYAANLTTHVDYTAAIQLGELDQAMRRLPRQQREALVLVHLAGLPYAKAAAECGVAIGTIKSRIARARASLHTWLVGPLAC